MAQLSDSFSARNIPKDAQVMAAILKDLDIQDYEPRILNQMLEFTYRYVSSVVDDAVLFSQHAKKKSVDAADAQFAIIMQRDKNFTTAPDRDLIVEIAKLKNQTPLPLIKSSAGGLRLPPDRYSLTSCNYRLKSNLKKSKTVHTVSRVNISTTACKTTRLAPTKTPAAVKFSEGLSQETSNNSLSNLLIPPATDPPIKRKNEDDDYDVI